MRDKSLLSLETSSFVRKYPDIQVDLLSALLSAREDIGRNDAKSIAEEAVNHTRFHIKGNDKEMIRLFQMAKAGGGRKMPAVDEIFQNVFSTFITVKNKS
jgi:hypothetical protein